jgi:hypothetical protein
MRSLNEICGGQLAADLIRNRKAVHVPTLPLMDCVVPRVQEPLVVPTPLGWWVWHRCCSPQAQAHSRSGSGVVSATVCSHDMIETEPSGH